MNSRQQPSCPMPSIRDHVQEARRLGVQVRVGMTATQSGR